MPGMSTLSDHPNADLVREVAAGAADGDITRLVEFLHPDVVWTNDVAAGPWAGTFEGRDRVLAAFGEFLAFMDGTFRQDLVDVWADDGHVVELLHETGTKDGHRFDNRAVYVLEIDRRVVTQAWTIDFDREAAAEFWRAVGR
jgi:ketosteroid isomerase-like protein